MKLNRNRSFISYSGCFPFLTFTYIFHQLISLSPFQQDGRNTQRIRNEKRHPRTTAVPACISHPPAHSHMSLTPILESAPARPPISTLARASVQPTAPAWADDIKKETHRTPTFRKLLRKVARMKFDISIAFNDTVHAGYRSHLPIRCLVMTAIIARFFRFLFAVTDFSRRSFVCLFAQPDKNDLSR